MFLSSLKCLQGQCLLSLLCKPTPSQKVWTAQTSPRHWDVAKDVRTAELQNSCMHWKGSQRDADTSKVYSFSSVQILSALFLSYAPFRIILALIPPGFPNNSVSYFSAKRNWDNKRTQINRNSLSRIVCTCWVSHSWSHSIRTVTRCFHPFFFPVQVVHIQTICAWCSMSDWSWPPSSWLHLVPRM